MEANNDWQGVRELKIILTADAQTTAVTKWTGEIFRSFEELYRYEVQIQAV